MNIFNVWHIRQSDIENMYTSFKVQIIKKETLRKAGKNMYYHPVFARYLSAKILVLIDRTVITYVLVQK